ncbi:ATP-binding cassette domain-containing protein [Alloscardovia macacae]|uniref:ABC-type quaternary amine transporter n=1 Tax=Alloscardovia macacae TaxID=1160091 RepID=A0A261F5X8_9BIFI|nr:ABC transporter ATP-binding protein [Alloscardovia macacae]OZG54306.1 glycine/betaine ABC transporter ATP-binding protein [Alloscardovia macacae]
MIEFQNVGKSYDGKNVLSGANFTIEDGEFFVLVGPSGSGKTTMLRMINGLEAPTDGDVRINGRRVADTDLRELRLNTGYVLQTGSLFPNLTVLQNIALIAKMKKWDESRIEEQARELLDRVGLPYDQYAQRMPADLSGGEAQRVGILRALITRPDVILMDEPFSALDPLSRTQLQDLVKMLHEDFHVTVVFVTHDMSEALKLADRVCVVHNGVIEQIGTPDEVKNHAATGFVSELFEGE